LKEERGSTFDERVGRVSAHSLGPNVQRPQAEEVEKQKIKGNGIGGTQSEKGRLRELFIEVVDEALNTSELDYLLQ
jgi:hypothetical protein